MRYFCHDHPEALTLETEVLQALPGRVRLKQSPLYPGGGGQLADRGLLRWAGGESVITGLEMSGGQLWHVLADPVEASSAIEVSADAGFRQMMREMHTATHILNALVFQNFDGALVTGVQMNDDGTARMDFDLPQADNEKLRALEDPINDVMRQNLPVNCVYVSQEEAQSTPGLIRSRSVAPPPTSDGLIRIVDIEGLDRQACGGTHLSSTGNSRPIKILKIDNKGRHNRRIRLGLVGLGPLA
jgi:misacylated tRNA(Ala) deacylase